MRKKLKYQIYLEKLLLLYWSNVSITLIQFALLISYNNFSARFKKFDIHMISNLNNWLQIAIIMAVNFEVTKSKNDFKLIVLLCWFSTATENFSA